MGSRIPSHQLSGGLYVSGPPEKLKERQPTVASRSVPYTGGDVKKSGELGKMFEISAADTFSALPQPRPSRLSSSHHNSGSARSGSNSGQLVKSSSSGPFPKKRSGPMTPLQPTGLITSGSLSSSGPIRSSGGGSRGSGQLVPSSSFGKVKYGSSVTSVTEDVKFGFKISRVVMWAFLVVMAMGLLVGVFLMVAVKKAVLLVAVAAILVLVMSIFLWNYSWRKRGLMSFLQSYPDAELRGAVDGQFVKVTGVVTCGSIPLESSYQRVVRCVYVSTELYEYRGCGGKAANLTQWLFSWGCTHSERYVADFYISDFQSGLRALVKAGYGSKVAPLIKPTTIVDTTKKNQEVSSNFQQWLADHNLLGDGKMMRLKEGYVKEGSTVSVMGMVRRQDNVLMIVPSTEPVSMGCRWFHFLLPTYLEGLVLKCDEGQNDDVIPV